LRCAARTRHAEQSDAFGLARHRDGRWEWARAPGVSPSARYQHSAVFVGARLHVSGGALGGGRMVDDTAAWAVLDTEAGQWTTWEGPEMAHVNRLCRQACASVGPLIFIYGGLRGGMLLDDMMVADDNWGESMAERWAAIRVVIDVNEPVWQAWTEEMRLVPQEDPGRLTTDARGGGMPPPGHTASLSQTELMRNSNLVEAAAQEAAAGTHAAAHTHTRTHAHTHTHTTRASLRNESCARVGECC